jgi:Zn-dependent protease with chaperone function
MATAANIPISKMVWIFLAAATAALMVGAQLLAGRYGLLGGFFASLALSAHVLAYSELRLARIFPARELEGQDAWGARPRLDRLAPRLGLATGWGPGLASAPFPRLYVFDCETPAVFSLGLGAWDSGIYLSRALLDEFAPAEIDAVLAHEALRLANLDIARLTLGSALAAGLFGLGRAIDVPFAPLRFVLPGTLRPGSLLMAPLAGLLLATFDRPRRCLLRDREAAALIGDAGSLASALWKLENYAATRPFNVAFPQAPLFMVNPLTRGGWYRSFIAQPTVQRRIKSLIGQYPL